MSVIQTLSPGEKFSLFFHGKTALLGLIFFFFGMIFLLVFGSASDISQVSFWLSPKGQANGRIIEVARTNYNVNERNVIKYGYEYTVQGQRYFGTSYSSRKRLFMEGEVEVEYLAYAPKRSRIEGMLRRPFSFWVIFFVGIFPAVGLAFLASDIRSTSRQIHILQNSGVTTAKLLSATMTNTRINNRPVYKVELEYTVLGETYRNVTKTLSPHLLGDNEHEPLLYSRKRPEQSVMFDMLPLAIQDKLGLRFQLLKDHHYGAPDPQEPQRTG